MKRFRLGLIGLFWSVLAWSSETPILLPLEASQAYWTFAGTVNNESGERYHYFFEINRDGNQYQGQASLIDGQTKSVLLYETGTAKLEGNNLSQWRVGNLFLRFNAITGSWVFGVKVKKVLGFNFKVDMLEQASTEMAKKYDVRDGVMMLINQTGGLNGHVQSASMNKEEFVTAKKAWFRQVWASKPQSPWTPLRAVLCDFNDGNGFYSMAIPKIDPLHATLAGWRDVRGHSLPMSQFISIIAQANNEDWQIHIPVPKAALSFKNLLADVDHHGLVLGLTNGSRPGFCAINTEDTVV